MKTLLCAALLGLASLAQAATVTRYYTAGRKLAIVGAAPSLDAHGNNIYLYTSINELGHTEAVLFDVGNPAVGAGACVFEAEDNYIHCDLTGITALDIRTGANPDNVFVFAPLPSVMLPGITDIRVRGRGIGWDEIGMGNTTHFRDLFPNLQQLRISGTLLKPYLP